MVQRERERKPCPGKITENSKIGGEAKQNGVGTWKHATCTISLTRVS